MKMPNKSLALMNIYVPKDVFLKYEHKKYKCN